MYHKLAYRTEFQGMPISVENRAGSNRNWYDPKADEHGKTKMEYPYGYVRGTLGLDDDEVDVFLGPDKKSNKVFVVTQMERFKFKKVDEQKVMLGFSSVKAAKAAYLRHYDDDRFFGSMKEMTVEEFKSKLKSRKGKIIKSKETLYISKSMVESNILNRLNLYLDLEKCEQK